MPRRFIPAIIAAIALAGLASPAVYSQDHADGLDAADAHFAAGEYSEAVTGYIAYLQHYPADRFAGSVRVVRQVAWAHALMGEAESALRYVAIAVRAGWRDATEMCGDPHLAALREDPRFVALVHAVARADVRLDDLNIDAFLAQGRPQPGRPQPGRPQPGRPQPGQPDQPGQPAAPAGDGIVEIQAPDNPNAPTHFLGLVAEEDRVVRESTQFRYVWNDLDQQGGRLVRAVEAQTDFQDTVLAVDEDSQPVHRSRLYLRHRATRFMAAEPTGFNYGRIELHPMESRRDEEGKWTLDGEVPAGLRANERAAFEETDITALMFPAQEVPVGARWEVPAEALMRYLSPVHPGQHLEGRAVMSFEEVVSIEGYPQVAVLHLHVQTTMRITNQFMRNIQGLVMARDVSGDIQLDLETGRLLSSELQGPMQLSRQTRGGLELAHDGTYSRETTFEYATVDTVRPLAAVDGWVGWEIEIEGEQSYITKIYRDSPAHLAGLRVGDELLRIEDEAIWLMGQIHEHILNRYVGDVLPLTMRRGTTRLRMELVIAMKPEGDPVPLAQKPDMPILPPTEQALGNARLGLRLVENMSGMAGMRVVRVTRDGAAEAAGLRADDLIISFNGFPTHTEDDFRDALTRSRVGSTIVVEARRGDEWVELEMELVRRR